VAGGQLKKARARVRGRLERERKRTEPRLGQEVRAESEVSVL
jgi:hypothetical protein